MIDPFVILAPALLLAVVALLRFIGCGFQPGAAATSPDPPTFSPPPGEYTGTQMVMLTQTDQGSSIYYTTDGTTPVSPDSGMPPGTTQTYGGPITVTNSELITAIATVPADTDPSTPATGMYTIDQPIVLRQPLAEKNETTANISVATPPFTNPVTGQDLIVVWIWYNNATQSIASVSDTFNAAAAYQRAVGPTAGVGGLTGWQQELWYAKNVTGGANFVVTATFSSTPGAAFERSISAHEYSGASVTAPLDVTSAQAMTNNANVSSGAVATTAARLVFGAALFPGAGQAGPGFTRESSLRNNVTEDEPFVPPGTAEATFTVANGPLDWIAQMITLK
jgi:hypothetical protein